MYNAGTHSSRISVDMNFVGDIRPTKFAGEIRLR